MKRQNKDDIKEVIPDVGAENEALEEENFSMDLQRGLQERLEECEDLTPYEAYRGRDLRRERGETKKKRSPFKILMIVLGVILAIVLIGVAVLAAVVFQGKNSLLSHEDKEIEFTVPEKAEAELADENTGEVIYKGKKYCYNNKIVNILFMGVDKEQLNTSGSIGAGESGQADSLFLASVDTDTGKVNILGISRDSMVDVNVYSNKGNYIGTRELQLCLAYTYGDGRELSCENTMRSVSRLLYGVPIHSYAAIDLNAIAVLNDAVGGVEVTVSEDLAYMDPSLTAGTKVLLQGQQAQWFVRSRISEGPAATADSNSYRMDRQQQYVSAFARKVIEEMKGDLMLPVALYRAASDYMVTDLSASRVAYLASLFASKGMNAENMRMVPGEAVMGEKYAEYHVDEEKLYEIILDIFYEEQ